MGPCSGLTWGARWRSGVSLHQEGDGGGGAGKERYCLVMSGLCHVNTIDLDRQQNQRRRGCQPTENHSLEGLGTPSLAIFIFITFYTTDGY